MMLLSSTNNQKMHGMSLKSVASILQRKLKTRLCVFPHILTSTNAPISQAPIHENIAAQGHTSVLPPCNITLYDAAEAFKDKKRRTIARANNIKAPSKSIVQRGNLLLLRGVKKLLLFGGKSSEKKGTKHDKPESDGEEDSGDEFDDFDEDFTVAPSTGNSIYSNVNLSLSNINLSVPITVTDLTSFNQKFDTKAHLATTLKKVRNSRIGGLGQVREIEEPVTAGDNTSNTSHIVRHRKSFTQSPIPPRTTVYPDISRADNAKIKDYGLKHPISREALRNIHEGRKVEKEAKAISKKEKIMAQRLQKERNAKWKAREELVREAAAASRRKVEIETRPNSRLGEGRGRNLWETVLMEVSEVEDGEEDHSEEEEKDDDGIVLGE